MKNIHYDKQSGFSLIEMLMVTAIIGALASIAIPQYISYQEKARSKSCQANRRHIEMDERNYYLENDSVNLNINDIYSCPSEGIYVWLVLDPDNLEYPQVGCSIHFAGTSSSTIPIDDEPEEENVGENISYRNIEDGNSKKNDFVDEELITGDGDDTITVDDDVSGSDRTITTNDGDDTVIVGDDVQHGATIQTGEGNDIIEIGGTLDDATLDTGNGNDTINLQRIRDASIIKTGEGDDVVTIDDVSSTFDDGNISLEDGNDRLVLNDSLRGTDAQFDGGEGNDVLVLEDVSSRNWNRDIGENFQNFESVTLKDGTFSLDENNNLI